MIIITGGLGIFVLLIVLIMLCEACDRLGKVFGGKPTMSRPERGERDHDKRREKRVIHPSYPGKPLSTEEAIKRVITDHYSDPRRVIKVPVDELVKCMTEAKSSERPRSTVKRG